MENENNNNVVQETEVVEQKFCVTCGRPLDAQGRCSPCEFARLAEAQDIKETKKSQNSTIVFFILSILNVVGVAPMVLMFTGLWAIFGALSGDSNQYLAILLTCFAYFGASLFALIGFSINFAKKGKFLGKAFLLTFIGMIVGVISPFILLAFATKASTTTINTVEQKEDNVIIYEDVNYRIKQKSLSETLGVVKIELNVEKLNEEAKTLYFENYLFINHVYVTVKEESKKRQTDGGDITLTIGKSSNETIGLGHLDIVTLYFSYDKNKLSTNLSISNPKEVDIEKELTKAGYKMTIENDYFKAYYKPNTQYYINIYIVSKVDSDNSIHVSRIDADTPGYETMLPYDSIPLKEQNTVKYGVDYHPCDENMRYLKIYYYIYDGNGKLIGEERVAETEYDKPQFTKKYCTAK